MTFKKLFPVIGLIIAIAGACKKSNNATPLFTVNPNPIAGYSDSVWGVFQYNNDIFLDGTNSYDTTYNAYAVMNDDTGGYISTSSILINGNNLKEYSGDALVNPLSYYLPNSPFFKYYFFTYSNFPILNWQIDKGAHNPELSYSISSFPTIDSFLPPNMSKKGGCIIPVSNSINGADSFTIDFVYYAYSLVFNNSPRIYVSLLHLSYSIRDTEIIITPTQLGIMPSVPLTIYVSAYKTNYVKADNKTYAFRTEYIEKYGITIN